MIIFVVGQENGCRKQIGFKLPLSFIFCRERIVTGIMNYQDKMFYLDKLLEVAPKCG